MKAVASVVVAALGFVAGCTGDLDEPWQLDHDRIIAVRASPPGINPGETSRIDVLVGHKGAPVNEQLPDRIEVVSPQSLAGAIVGTRVVAPNEAALTAARRELALDPGAPVPLVIGVAAVGFAATKTVWLGETRTNPPFIDLTIDGAPVPPPTSSIVVARDQDVRLFVTADDAVDTVNWLTSCGTMHDFDLHSAYLRVEPDDPQEGQLALVLRDARGGASWQVWPIRAE